jgi:hypothetical protein
LAPVDQLLAIFGVEVAICLLGETVETTIVTPKGLVKEGAVASVEPEAKFTGEWVAGIQPKVLAKIGPGVEAALPSSNDLFGRAVPWFHFPTLLTYFVKLHD